MRVGLSDDRGDRFGDYGCKEHSSKKYGAQQFRHIADKRPDDGNLEYEDELNHSASTGIGSAGTW